MNCELFDEIYKVCERCKIFCRFLGYDSINKLRIPPISSLSYENAEKVRNTQIRCNEIEQTYIIHVLNRHQTEKWNEDLHNNFRLHYAGDKNLCYFPYDIKGTNYLWRCDSCFIDYS